ncbi:PTS system IID component, Man family [Coriobacterium glomerans PW2]|uniref:PTS system IID component, Man family n=1 Tax=Coriobacterium glomerans (strain ATCC 49209 / DSM 20642 / JCM 10262 / PW2) TaxID=700015 RepID=F2NB58_CORGP|nr:PTS system mannose/fructose/sorbose family transporter subunit IID [Coriobacterium glomerans]AEB07809.1 PTS system IID component, Man family [Coriobacterium glomerans PW2]
MTDTIAAAPDRPIAESPLLNTKDLRGVALRSYTIMGSFNYERMQGLGFLCSILKPLRKIYSGDDNALRAAMRRNVAAFNMTCAPSPFVMGITMAMEENHSRDPSLDPSSINAIKVSLMGPLSGIGDTFFWGIFRVLACSLAIGFATQGSPIAPFVLLLSFGIPNIAVRLVGVRLGYSRGRVLIEHLEKSGQMQLVTQCASIVGAMAIGCMIAMWVKISSPLVFTMGNMKIAVQDYLDQISPKLLPLVVTLGILWCLKKNIKVPFIILGIVVIGFLLGITGIIAM